LSFCCLGKKDTLTCDTLKAPTKEIDREREIKNEKGKRPERNLLILTMVLGLWL
jgi:hypothetical protein